MFSTWENMTMLIDLIKKTGAVREFQNKKIPDNIINNILTAGIWSFSILGIQPWYFVCIKNKLIINKIAKLLEEKMTQLPSPFKMIIKLTAKSIKNSSVLIGVYNNEKISSRLKKYGKQYVKRGYVAELQSIGGSIQNMYLMAASLGLGCVWVDSPNFFEKDINNIVGEEKELIAFLVLGYPAKKAHRSKRTMTITSLKRI